MATLSDIFSGSEALSNLRDEKLYITGGGFKGKPAKDKVTEFDLKSKTVKEMPKLNKARCRHSSVVKD